MRVDVNIFQAFGIVMVEQCFQHHAGAAAKRQSFGERGSMPEGEDILTQFVAHFIRLYKLRQVNSRETKIDYIHAFNSFRTGFGSIEFAIVALNIFLFAVDIPRNAETKFQERFPFLVFLVIVQALWAAGAQVIICLMAVTWYRCKFTVQTSIHLTL